MVIKHRQGPLTAAVFLDLSKAFDTVDLSILVTKLNQYGTHNMESKWFTLFLFGRRQIISLDGVHSDIMDISIGVPQGSILGPLLFL